MPLVQLIPFFPVCEKCQTTLKVRAKCGCHAIKVGEALHETHPDSQKCVGVALIVFASKSSRLCCEKCTMKDVNVFFMD